MAGIEIQIPKDLENLALPDPYLLNYYKQAQNRIIWVDGEINESILEMTKQILLWNMEDADTPVENRKPIRIFIFSPGGLLEETLHVCDTIKQSVTPVYTYNMGIAMSGAFLILISGHKRFAFPMSRAMFHQGQGGASGVAGQAMDDMKNYEALLSTMRQHILDNTKITAQMYTKKKDRNWYLSAEEQIKHGVVDEVTSSLSEIF